MKKVLLFSLVLLFFSNVVLQYSEFVFLEIFNFHKSFISNRNENLKTITLSKKEWQSTVDKDEIEFKNHFYDIKQVTIDNETITLCVYEDIYESYIQFLKKTLETKTKNKNSKEKLKNKRLVCYTFFTINEIQFIPHYKEIAQHYFHLQNKYKSHLSLLIQPPISFF